MTWITFAILAVTSFGFYNLFVKLTADKLSPTIALMFIAGTSFVVATIATLIFKFTGQSLTFSKNAILFPILAGISTGVAEIFYLFMFTKNAPLNVGTPFVVGGTIVAAVILSLFILKEPLSAVKIAGILMALTGLILLTRG